MICCFRFHSFIFSKVEASIKSGAVHLTIKIKHLACQTISFPLSWDIGGALQDKKHRAIAAFKPASSQKFYPTS
jgi:hypothetical protein